MSDPKPFPRCAEPTCEHTDLRTLRAEVERLKTELASLNPAPPTCGECGAELTQRGGSRPFCGGCGCTDPVPESLCDCVCGYWAEIVYCPSGCKVVCSWCPMQTKFHADPRDAVREWNGPI